MSTGSRRFPIDIQEDQGETRDPETNELTQDGWVTVYSCFADLNPIAGREFWQGQQVRADVDYGIEIMAPDSIVIVPKMRAKYGERIFQFVAIRNPSELGRCTQMYIQAKEERGQMDA